MMNQLRAFYFALFFTAFMVICAANNAGAVDSPDAILWGAPADAFVRSLYRGVFGRQPSTEIDMATVQALSQKLVEEKTDRIKLFWAFINSSEYKASRWAAAEREYTIYWKTREAVWPNGSTYLCRCYYFTKDIGSAGYLPNIQYTGLADPPDKLTFGEAAALTPFYARHDREVCPSAECNGGGTTASNESRPREYGNSGVAVAAKTSPDPRRVGQRYTFTLMIENYGMDAVRISSVSAKTSVNGRPMGGSGKAYFSPQNHSGRGWLTSVAPSGRRTVIYQGTGTATADSVGLWETDLTFHTDHGDFPIHTTSQVIR